MRPSPRLKGSLVLGLSLLALLVLTLAVTTPRQAEACCGDGAAAAAGITSSTGAQTTSLLGQWATDLSNWASNFTFLTNIITGINTFTKTFVDEATALGALINGGQIGQAEAAVRIGQGTADSIHQSAAASAVATVAGRFTPPSSDNQQLCNVIGIRQGPAAARWFYDATGAQTAKMIEDRGRGPGEDADGPQYAADERNIRCGKKADGTPNPLGFATANAIDGYPASCIAADPALVDADIRYSTLSGLQVFEMPSLLAKTFTLPLGGTTTVYVPKPTNLEQKLYVAATNFCAFAAGPRPTPPSGADLNSPEGVAATAAFDHATAISSAFVSQCTKRVAELTRPNCGDATQYANASIKAVCDSTKKACEAFVAAGGTLTPDITCSKGMSPHQADYVSHMACKVSQYYTAAAGAGVSHGELANFSTLCDISATAWEAQQADAEAALVEGFRGLQAMQGLYAGAGRNPGKTMRIRAPAETPKPRLPQEASIERPAKKVAVKTQQIDDMELPEGVPFDADRMSLPATLAQ